MSAINSSTAAGESVPPPFPAEPQKSATPAWEEIEAGRYRPRRICGSNPGRELG